MSTTVTECCPGTPREQVLAEAEPVALSFVQDPDAPVASQLLAGALLNKLAYIRRQDAYIDWLQLIIAAHLYKKAASMTELGVAIQAPASVLALWWLVFLLAQRVIDIDALSR